MNPVLIGIGVYVLLQLAIGLWVSRSIRDEDDYLVAGRRLRLPMAVFTVFATWFGAETCLGAAGRVYEEGLSGGAADPFGYAACLVLAGLVFATALWRRHYTTVADLFRERYGAGVERVAVLLMVPTSVLWAAAQIRGFGQVLAIAGIGEVEVAITVATLIVIVYTTFGGLLADAVTDIVQGSLLILGLVLLWLAVDRAEGGMFTLLATLPEERLAFGAAAASPLAIAELWAIPIFGSLVAQELISRMLAAHSAVTARRAMLIGAGLYLAVGLIPVSLGLVGASLVPGLEHGDQVLPALAERHLSTFLFVVFAGALVSAILSTVDSALLAASALVSHNLLPAGAHASQATRVRRARSTVVMFGVLAWLLALHADSVFELVEAASAFGSAGIVVVAVFGLHSRIGGMWSAYVALAVGALVYVGGEATGWLTAPYLTALVLAVLAYLVVAAFEGSQPSVPVRHPKHTPAPHAAH
jgi:Na+/proline symporter